MNTEASRAIHDEPCHCGRGREHHVDMHRPAPDPADGGVAAARIESEAASLPPALGSALLGAALKAALADARELRHERAEARKFAALWKETARALAQDRNSWRSAAALAEHATDMVAGHRDQCKVRAEKAEAALAEMTTLRDRSRDTALKWQVEANRLRTEQSRGFTADDLTVDELAGPMIERARQAARDATGALWERSLVRRMLEAALTPPPARPEGAEDLDGHVDASLRGVGLNPLSADEIRLVADNLASEGVRAPGAES